MSAVYARAVKPPWRDEALAVVVAFVGAAAFPRLAWRLLWPTRLRGRALVLYILGTSVLSFALRAWLVPTLRGFVDRQEHARAELRGRLGREPTPDELQAHLFGTG